MKYYRELAFALRVRGLPEDDILSTLRDVQTHSTESNSDPREEFGDPNEFAKRFEKQTRTTIGKLFLMIATVSAIVVVLVGFALSALLELQLRVGPLCLPLAIAVVFVIVGLAGGFMFDRRIPAGFLGKKTQP